jgi:CubicO group peptidase (beta-lactamase class C family)
MGYIETINQIDASLFAAMQHAIDSAIDDLFPALSLAVIHRGEFVFEAAWGWIDPETRQHPVTPATLFDLASVTKPFTVTAFLSLVSAGKIGLDDALVQVVPEFGAGGARPIDGGQDPHTKAMLPAAAEMQGQWVDPADITFRQLLTHTSGLAPWRAVYLEAGDPPIPPDAVEPIPRDVRWKRGLAAICAYPFVGTPDSAFRYSDLGMMLLGESVARLHGAPLDVAVGERVLSPLGLNDSLYNPARNGRTQIETVPTEDDPDWRGRRCWGEVHDENACGVGGVAGHAGLFGAAHDVARFGQSWLTGDARLKLTSDIWQTATQEQYAEPDLRRGLGWKLQPDHDSAMGDVYSHESYGHTGFTGTSLWIDPERELVVVCLTNRVYPGRHYPGFEVFQENFHTLIAQGFPPR